MNQKEIWKDIKGFEGYYQISNLGRLKSFKAVNSGRVLSNTNNTGWYFNVVLTIPNGVNKRSVKLHALVAETFIGKRPKGFYVHHKDHNKQNNRLSNLEYVSPSDHSRISIKENPNIIRGMVHYNQNVKTFPIIQLDMDGNYLNEFKNGREASLSTGVCHRNILQVANKTEYKPGLTRKQAGGFIWKLKEDAK